MDFLDLALRIGELKKLKRSGWVREKVKNPESIADHSFRTTILAMVLAPLLNLDQNKLIKMALVHDIGEVESGDVVWERGDFGDEEERKKKEEIEKKAIGRIFKKFGEEYINLFRELLERKSDEAKVLWQIDRLERMIQAMEYEKNQGVDLSEFFANAEKNITDPKLREIMQQILTQRAK